MTTTTAAPIASTKRYPIFFVPNQVLTDKDLNGLVSYLDDQSHLTRTHLIGMGIVGGLEIQVTENKASGTGVKSLSVQITPGCGLTSVGDLITLPEQGSTAEVQDQAESFTVLTRYKELTEAKDLVSEALFFGEAQSSDKSSSETYQVIELFKADNAQPSTQPTQQAAISDLKEITEKVLQNKVLVVVRELQEEQKDLCFLDADNRGVQRNFRLRFFLLHRDMTQEANPTAKPHLSAERLLRQGYQMDELKAPWENVSSTQKGSNPTLFSTTEVLTARSTFLKNFMPKVYRFGYRKAGAKETTDLTQIVNYDEFNANYIHICGEVISEIKRTFPQLFRLFSPFFTRFRPSSDNFDNLEGNLRKTLENFLKNYGRQYFYDYLSQLVAAYEELATVAFDLMDDCPPSTQCFPNFLMLGEFPKTGELISHSVPPSPYRSHFTQPPLYNGNELRLNQVRHLYQRLLQLCQPDSFNLPILDEKKDLKITPSKDRSYPLSQQAISYYLKYENVYQYWSYDAYRKGRSASIPAYFIPGTSGIEERPIGHDLVYRLDAYDFYRIEGHIGKQLSELVGDLEGVLATIPRSDPKPVLLQARQDFNLDFEICCLELELKHQEKTDLYKLFYQFAKSHPGMEHLGGVPKGGTFILVYIDFQSSDDPEFTAPDAPVNLVGSPEIMSAATNPPTLLKPGMPAKMAVTNLNLLAISVLLAQLQEMIGSFSFTKDSRIVIADFCLPYRYYPSYYYSRLNAFAQPMMSMGSEGEVSLGKTDFCGGDTTRYQFILAPNGGSLEGEGIIQEHDHHYFQPSLLGPVPLARELTFTYSVNGNSHTLVVKIHPLPNATFIIGDGSSERFLIHDDPVLLKPDQIGGSFKAWQEPIDGESEQPQPIPGAITFQDGQFFFNPAVIQLDHAPHRRVRIEYTITNEANCINQLSVSVMVVPQIIV